MVMVTMTAVDSMYTVHVKYEFKSYMYLYIYLHNVKISFCVLCSLQLECETNAELHFEITPHIATIIQCLDRVFATPDTISEVNIIYTYIMYIMNTYLRSKT